MEYRLCKFQYFDKSDDIKCNFCNKRDSICEILMNTDCAILDVCDMAVIIPDDTSLELDTNRSSVVLSNSISDMYICDLDILERFHIAFMEDSEDMLDFVDAFWATVIKVEDLGHFPEEYGTIGYLYPKNLVYPV